MILYVIVFFHCLLKMFSNGHKWVVITYQDPWYWSNGSINIHCCECEVASIMRHFEGKPDWEVLGKPRVVK